MRGGDVYKYPCVWDGTSFHISNAYNFNNMKLSLSIEVDNMNLAIAS